MGLNQTDFGAIGGVTKATQINYEKGERSPDANYLLAVTARGVDLMYVLTGVRGEHTERPLTADQAVLLDGFALMNDEAKAAVLMMIAAMAKSYRAG